jgi:ABC-type nitrate/sulfonate/bicarbonate transport system ATPase subunit
MRVRSELPAIGTIYASNLPMNDAADMLDGSGAKVAQPEVRASAAANQAAISFAQVWKSFSASDGSPLEVLHDVSFDVPSGQIVAILGPSGSGKSTLLNMAAGLLQPDRGRVILRGQETTGAVDWSRVGYMFQDDRLLPWRVAVKNVSLALEAGSVPAPERKERARAGLALVGLADFAETYPHQLSGGMRSRVALARSLVTEPDILLMDEPFSRLDAQTRGAMHRELLRIQELRRMTILFVTHDVEEAVVLADHIVVLSARPGRVRQRVAVPFGHPRIDLQETSDMVAALRTSLETETQETL